MVNILCKKYRQHICVILNFDLKVLALPKMALSKTLLQFKVVKYVYEKISLILVLNKD